jgi:hypothetical protein
MAASHRDAVSPPRGMATEVAEDTESCAASKPLCAPPPLCPAGRKTRRVRNSRTAFLGCSPCLCAAPVTSANLFVTNGGVGTVASFCVRPREATRRRPTLCPPLPLLGKTRQPQPNLESFLLEVSSVPLCLRGRFCSCLSLRLCVSAVNPKLPRPMNADAARRLSSVVIFIARPPSPPPRVCRRPRRPQLRGRR